MFHINGYHLRQYIQSRQNWTNKTWDRIDLELFGSFYRKLNPRGQVAHTKFIFDQWHMGTKRARVSIIKDMYVDKCPCCRVHVETVAHVLQCLQNPDRAQAISEFRKNMSPTEYHPVFHLLKDGIQSWLDGSTYAPDIATFPRKMRDRITLALLDQETIGWDNALKGYMSVEWQRLADESPYDNVPATQSGKGLNSLRTILRHAHNVTQRLWKSRNQVLHQTDDQDLRAIRDSELREIRELHAHPEHLQAGDRHYCNQPIETLLKKNPASRRRWLRYTRMSRDRMIKDGKRQSLLTQFFRRQDISGPQEEAPTI